MTKISLALVAALAFASAAQAQSVPNTFKDQNGVTWTVTSGDVAPPSKLHMSPDAAQACPGLRVKLEASKLGPKMTKEQKFRGDQRWHIVCDRSQPQQAAK